MPSGQNRQFGRHNSRMCNQTIWPISICLHAGWPNSIQSPQLQNVQSDHMTYLHLPSCWLTKLNSVATTPECTFSPYDQSPFVFMLAGQNSIWSPQLQKVPSGHMPTPQIGFNIEPLSCSLSIGWIGMKLMKVSRARQFGSILFPTYHGSCSLSCRGRP